MAVNKIMITAGIITVVQAVGQLIFTGLGLAQYFCVIDFLQELPLLLYIRILYFHNPDHCGFRINIGHAIDGIADQAFVLITREPLPVFRTFIINCTSVGLSTLWIITSGILMTGGAKNARTRLVRWPWIITTVFTCILDVVASVTFINDSFYTRTLSDIMSYVGGMVSGIGNAELNTAWAAWVMTMVYSRFVALFFTNLLLLVLVVIDGNLQRSKADVQVEAPIPASIPAPPTPPIMAPLSTCSIRDEEASLPSEEVTRIPRPGLSRAFRRMKTLLFNRQATPAPRRSSVPESLEPTPERSPRAADDKKRTVNFPENLLSLPQRLENLIAEQQRRLDRAVIDTSGRNVPRASQSLPQLSTETDQDNITPEINRGRRGTAAELQGQMPWAYIPASAHRMRDQLPPDEDLPPVPLPDYTAIPSFRKTSVHRAASSLSSLTQKREYLAAKAGRPPLTQSDVLY
ncbi:unnamed protein product [Parnassius mnemosyne]|uniref:Uncharacterized protein n=1 Tax=Parnassius mnemosyne TaxID=213953 RepID=A0AAV1L414_9NEOP